MNLFEDYVHELEFYAKSALAGKNHLLENADFAKHLNGGVGVELRRRVSLKQRQEMGAFFTGATLRDRAFAIYGDQPLEGAVWDPACGAGDLLLSYAERLPVFPDLATTLAHWGKKLYGSDTQELFLRAARARLVLVAFLKGARKINKTRLNLRTVFPNLLKCDSLKTPPKILPVEIALNPPYISIEATQGCEWAGGSVSAAAVFVEMSIRIAAPGARIVAILPDVLRTGSRYDRWRRMVAKEAKIQKIDIYGPFDPQADVDVFVLVLQVKRRPGSSRQVDPWMHQESLALETLGDYFSVSVGPVVPHRHKEEGPSLPFLHSKEATPWHILRQLGSRLCFSGTVHKSPFVVIRRTSSPSDRARAVATIVNSSEPVAVENHLIVCKPKDGKLSSCRALVDVLRSDQTNSWLNSRIRCRHLTVGSVREIPIG